MTEQQLRKALGAADDLEPPADELFAQRALHRGRSRLARRRRAVLGAAAGVALVSVVGGTQLVRDGQWSASTGSDSASVARDAGAPEAASGGDTGGLMSPMPPARDGSAWLTGPVTRQSAILGELIPTLALDFPEVFGGAYASDPTNTRLVVTVTRRDPALEELVSTSMPSRADVSYEVVTNTAAAKEEVMARIAADAPGWLDKGVTIVGVRIDARADRVVVTVREASATDVIEQRYGTGIVAAEIGVGPPLGGTLTEPGLPTPQR